MPYWDLICPACGAEFDALLERGAEGAPCPVCGEPAQKQFTGAPRQAKFGLDRKNTIRKPEPGPPPPGTKRIPQ